ncbi:hypothetical protein scyTo_0000580 [Scyliorhinus torazame]|uniref:Uncharacterized protein n=1 Tax=Scyliorhinus torazame TaxID=75743 RepID=A0A401NZS6_SCYTO|nr:hypothetical protein [Scyliorhinus torazame]
MGKEQELLEAARIGNVAVVEKLLTGKRGLLGSGPSSIPLSSLLRMYKRTGCQALGGPITRRILHGITA